MLKKNCLKSVSGIRYGVHVVAFKFQLFGNVQ